MVKLISALHNKNTNMHALIRIEQKKAGTAQSRCIYFHPFESVPLVFVSQLSGMKNSAEAKEVNKYKNI